VRKKTERDSGGIAIALRTSLNKCAKRDLSMNTKFQSAYKSTYGGFFGKWAGQRKLGASAKTCEMQKMRKTDGKEEWLWDKCNPCLQIYLQKFIIY